MRALTFQNLFLMFQKRFRKLSDSAIHRLNCECPQRREIAMANVPSTRAINLMILIRSLAFDAELELDMSPVKAICVLYDTKGLDGVLKMVASSYEHDYESLMDTVWEIMNNRNFQALENLAPLTRRVNTLDFILKNADRIRQEF